ncbi:MAG: hypothetical protein HY553_01245 [Elusimicrobia bacterium]|nr:hypothetical protein [Elusimicrobiota bacterium]
MSREEETPPHHLVSVFEASNETLKEVLLGVTARLLQRLVREHQKTPPPAIAHWSARHNVDYRCLDYSVKAREARGVIERRAKALRARGWRVLK